VPVFDCDFWAQKATIALIAPFMSSSWREWLRVGETLPTGGAMQLPESQYFVELGAVKRAAGGQDPAAETRDYLGRNGIGLAVFNPGAATSVAGLASPMLAVEVARSVNDWTVAEWLGVDGRLCGSIVVAPHDPRQAAAEARRAASNERMVQIVVAFPPRLLGDRFFDPLYEAACELGLPIVLQAGGDYSGSNSGLSAVGHPSSMFEAFVAWEYGGQPQLISLVCNGVFDRFPRLRVVFSGFGVAWLPSVLWRLDREFARGRVPLPASLERLPSEYINDHLRFTTAQIELSEEPGELVELLSMVGGQRLLLFASGPQRDDPASDLEALLALPRDWQGQLYRTAAECYPRAVLESARSA
jgi:predicted TIM-barrel fold metal-dependent hydrolase